MTLRTLWHAAKAHPIDAIGRSVVTAAWAVLAIIATRLVLAATHGEAATPLDDAYIHFQYARAVAHGAPFVYSPGAAPVPGATSVLWPIALAPFTRAASPAAVIWAAWVYGWLATLALAHEAWSAAAPLGSRWIGPLAAALILGCGAFAWFASSGMEVVPLAWLLLRTARRCADWIEAHGERSAGAPARWELFALAWTASILRPEGALAAAMAFTALIVVPATGRRAVSALALLGPVVPPLCNWVGTGHATSTTAQVKWLALSPYVTVRSFFVTVESNIETFFGILLDGRLWSWAYLPEGWRIVGWMAPLGVVYATFAHQKRWRGALLFALLFAILVPTTYDSFLWNRLRYLWPFASAWLISVALLADQIGLELGRLHRHLRWAGPVLGVGVLVGLARKLPVAVGDLAASTGAIFKQHVSLGRWAKTHVPEGARIGVNDTGAIAYYSGHPIFDIVGLTTQGEARYWSAGAGSRFEHYEHLAPSALPPYFIVYPRWMDLAPLLGLELTERSVYGPGSTILGGTTMVAYVADYRSLNSGTLPENEPGRFLDAVDVADLESEASHAFHVFWGSQADDVLVTSLDGRADGGRLRRTLDRFDLRLAPGGTLVCRLGARNEMTVDVAIDGDRLGSLTLVPSEWQELTLTLPQGLRPGVHWVDVRAQSGRAFRSMHYWSYAPP